MKLVSINDFVYRISDGDFNLLEKNADPDMCDDYAEFLYQLQKKYKPLYRLDYQVRYD